MRSGTAEVSGLPLAWDEQGEGRPVLLVHGAALGRRLWDEAMAELAAGGARAIRYDRRGYGDSGAPEPYSGTTVEEQAEDAAALLGALGGAPAVVCGHELGALVALDLVRRHGDLAHAAVAIEPPLLWLSARGSEATAELREAVRAGARDGGVGGAIDAYLRSVGGERVLETLGEARAAAMLASARAFAADLAAAPLYEVAPRELRAIDAPVAVLAGARADPVRREAAAALARMVPGASLHEPDAGHFVPVEDPHAVAAAVRGLIDR